MKSKRPQKKTRREKRRFKKKTIILISSIIIIIGSFFYVMNHDFVAIASLEIRGQKTIIESDVRGSLERYFDTDTMRLIRRDNVLLLNIGRVEEFLREEFPKIEDLSVEINDGDILTVVIGERSVHSLWCINRVYESEFDEECYFADKNGLLYARAPYFSGNIYMKLYVEPKEDIDYIGTVVNNIDDFGAFFSFLSLIESEYPVALANVYFDDFGDVALELQRIKDITYNSSRPKLLFNLQDDYNTVVRNIGLTLNFDEFKKDFAKKSSLLESIDIRFDGRIFYTFASTVPIDSESE